MWQNIEKFKKKKKLCLFYSFQNDILTHLLTYNSQNATELLSAAMVIIRIQIKAKTFSEWKIKSIFS